MSGERPVDAEPEAGGGWQRGTCDGEPTVVLEHGGARLEVAEKGATVLGWSVAEADGQPVELAESYASAEDLEANESAAFAVMAPFSNRIAGGTYIFGGVEHDLRPGLHAAETEVIHGLVRRVRWEVVDAGGTVQDAGAEPRLTMATAVRDRPGYPFALTVRVTYTLGSRSLTFDLEATNVGEDDAPVSLGWHPYFRLPGHDVVDGLELEVPARARVIAEGNFPLEGAAAYADVPDGVAAWRPIGAERLDAAHVVPEEEDVVSVVRSPVTGAAVVVSQDGREARVMHVYSGDTLPARRRASLAMEPVGLLTNAFNRADCADVLPLAPGRSRRLRARVEYRPGA